MRIFVDMDELITDFVGGAAKRWGVRREILEEAWTPGEWDMVPPLRRALNRPGLTEDAFWLQLNGSEDFWVNLLPTPFAGALLETVKAHSDDWWIVTAPSRCGYSYSGKVKWLKNYFGVHFDRFLLTPHKYLFARPGAVLIDDRDRNVEEFRKAGGTGIVFPRLHNSMFALRPYPVEYVGSQLFLLKEHPLRDLAVV